MLDTLEGRKIAESNRNLRNAVIPDDIIDKNVLKQQREKDFGAVRTFQSPIYCIIECRIDCWHIYRQVKRGS